MGALAKGSLLNFFLLLTIVLPHLEYYVQVWHKDLIRDIVKLDKFQEVFTICVHGIRHLSYPERLDRTKLFSLSIMRLWEDHTENFKFVSDAVAVDPISPISNDSHL